MANLFESDSVELDIPNAGCRTSMSLHPIIWKLVNLQAETMSVKMKLAHRWQGRNEIR